MSNYYKGSIIYTNDSRIRAVIRTAQELGYADFLHWYLAFAINYKGEAVFSWFRNPHYCHGLVEVLGCLWRWQCEQIESVHHHYPAEEGYVFEDHENLVAGLNTETALTFLDSAECARTLFFIEDRGVNPTYGDSTAAGDYYREILRKALPHILEGTDLLTNNMSVPAMYMAKRKAA